MVTTVPYDGEALTPAKFEKVVLAGQHPSVLAQRRRGWYGAFFSSI